MTYIPLARKWRPKTFADLLGQEHVVFPLQNALNQNKLHHAYLFTGTRGVGKTTVARIFAKALNCQQGIVAQPCLSCENCLGIDEACFYDLIEVDAASRTRVEDTRELIENIQYAPASGRFKIFLIDEVHMLSTHSFNALLKTLEEPPEHVKFLLATTDPQKIPATILSRCLQFNLKAITPDIISQQLSIILNDAQFTYDPQSLAIIATHANGSMRDAITLTEQLISAFPNGFKQSELKDFLGLSLEDQALNILKLISEHEIQALIKICQELETAQAPYHQLLYLLMQLLHQCAIVQIIPNHTTNDRIQALSKDLSTDFIQKAYLILEKSNQNLDWAPHPAIGFQMSMLRIYQALESPKNPQLFKPEPLVLEETAQESSDPPKEIQAEDTDWAEIVNQLPIDGIGKSALNNANFLKKEFGQLHLQVKQHFFSLFSPAIKERIELALTNYFHEDIRIQLHAYTDATSSQSTPAELKQKKDMERHHLLLEAVTTNPLVQQLQHDCNAEILKKSMTFTLDNL
ncbi:MAG: DNA polymerase III subunit gamma/tau [Gammaproteobacteria bacterium]|nr:DNA polymerase III subunit gamma/tau [Gammaproteobacteria bacterium]